MVSPLAELPASCSTECAVPGCSKDTGQARGTKHQQPQPSLKSKGPSCPSPGLDALVLAGASPPELGRKSPQSLEDLELRACCGQHQQSPRDCSISCGVNVQPASADALLRHLFAASLATSPDLQSGLAADLGAGNRQAAGQHPAHQSRVTPSHHHAHGPNPAGTPAHAARALQGSFVHLLLACITPARNLPSAHICLPRSL